MFTVYGLVENISVFFKHLMFIYASLKSTKVNSYKTNLLRLYDIL